MSRFKSFIIENSNVSDPNGSPFEPYGMEKSGMKKHSKVNIMENALRLSGATAACALILNAATSYGHVIETEAQRVERLQRMNDSSRKENSMSSSTPESLPDASYKFVHLKDADDLIAKYVQVADLTVDQFTPEAIETIFGIKFEPRYDLGDGDFVTNSGPRVRDGKWFPQIDQPNANEYPLTFHFRKLSPPQAYEDITIHWPDFVPHLRVDYQKLKAQLEKHGWVIDGPAPNPHGGPVHESFIRSDGTKNRFIRVSWTHIDGVARVIDFVVHHNFAVGEQK